MYNLDTRKIDTRPLHNFDKILDYSYSDDGKKFAFSAVQFGQSDIFIYDIISNTYLQVTKDSWDDLYPRFINKSREVVFSSNRVQDSIKAKDSSIVHRDANLDLFIYDYKTRSQLLKRVSSTKFADEIMPVTYDTAHFAYISDANGIQNRYLARIDSTIAFIDTITHYRWFTTSFPITNYQRNLLQMDAAPKAGVLGEVYYENGRYKLLTKPISSDRKEEVKLNSNFFRSKQEKDSKRDTKKKEKAQPKPIPAEKPKIEVPKPKANPDEIDIDNYVFTNETYAPKKKTGIELTKDSINAQNQTNTQASGGDRLSKRKEKEKQKHGASGVAEDTITFKLAKQRNYEIRFSTDYVVTQLDNSFTSSSYQKYTGGGAVYFNPGINGLFKLGASDLFEDYKIVGGFRIAANLNSNEFFLSWQNLKKRLDKQVFFHRQAFSNPAANYPNKVQSHTLSYILRYPFTENSAVKATILGRHDRVAYLSVDEANLRKPNDNTYLGGIKLEYIFDNTISRGLNLFQGARYKIFGEFYHHVNNTNYFAVVGADFRHYTRIHRDLIWANRFAGSSSLGNEKLLYYLGGVDNWIGTKYDNSIPVSQTENYQYQAIATNMRGFYQNIRNGTNFAVINSEIRWPIFRYLVNRPIKSEFINNFQLIGFGDMGTAWNGLTPYSDRNTFNTKIIQDGSLTIKLKNTTDPLVYGFGFGARTKILGYFVRADYAWGAVDGIILKPIFYLSFSMDF